MQREQALGDRGQAAPAVDEDRNAPLGSQREHGLEPLVVQQEALRPGMQLDPAGSGVERAHCLLHRARRQVEAHEGDEEPVRSSAAFSVRSFAARKAGSRSGSSRQKAKARSTSQRWRKAARSSYGATIPSMSRPTWTCASNRVAPAG